MGDATSSRHRALKGAAGIAAAAGGVCLMIWGGAWSLFAFGPLLIAAGGVALARAAFPGRTETWGCTVSLAGLILLGVGALPMALLATGLMADNEASGMLATLLAVMVGGPGLVVTLMGLALRVWERW